MDDSHPALQTDSFMLVIQTQFQMEVYQEYATTMIQPMEPTNTALSSLVLFQMSTAKR